MKNLLRVFSLSVIFLILVTILVVIGGYIWYQGNLEPVSSSPSASQLFVIPKGASVTKVANLLQQKGLIRQPLVFRFYARQAGLDRDLQAGSYDLSPAMGVAQIVAILQQGSQAVWVTLPEGLRVEEVAERLAAASLPKFDKTVFVALARPSEGRLFPDTYLIPRESTAQQVFALLTRTFQDKVETGLAAQLQASALTPEQIVVLASLIQRESNSPEDMRQVAGVIANRLRIGMKLDIDATLAYARGYDQTAQSWWSAPDPALKASDSPYNTYRVAGLPPTPIANPGVAAIEAALEPARTSALYYLHTPSGKAYYADTYEQHQANIARYLQ